MPAHLAPSSIVQSKQSKPATLSSSPHWIGWADRHRTCSPSQTSSAARGAGLRVLNLGGGDVDTSTPMGSMLFTVMAALAQVEHRIKRERIVDSISKRRIAGKDLGGRRQRVTDSQIRSALSTMPEILGPAVPTTSHTHNGTRVG